MASTWRLSPWCNDVGAQLTPRYHSAQSEPSPSLPAPPATAPHSDLGSASAVPPPVPAPMSRPAEAKRGWLGIGPLRDIRARRVSAVKRNAEEELGMVVGSDARDGVGGDGGLGAGLSVGEWGEFGQIRDRRVSTACDVSRTACRVLKAGRAGMRTSAGGADGAAIRHARRVASAILAHRFDPPRLAVAFAFALADRL
jgi:hypothetical protein